ncbi:amino acid adenylation domain-containing protein [Niastella populi]|uniref:amino acid adenylation domain-containing protein n=1 Tax=Niastella populi TaxID=550983 RepID=UPI001F610AFF
MYKTGDLGCWLSDGNIEFIGRKDEQVKIRGHRIEPGEIEHALLNHEAIKEAVVLTKENESGEKELVAYITSNAEQNTSGLRDYLKEQLPAYMLPAHFVQLKEMPLTANGKVDRKSLPAPEGLGLTSGVEYVAPRTALEEKLVKIWEEVLERENIGVNDDFFALGGHSLKGVRLGNEYQKELSVKLSLKELFAHTSIASHAVLIASSTREAFVHIEKVTPQASYAISDGQRRLWVLSQFEGGSAAYNMPGSIYLNQDIEIENFKRAIDSTIERHEILRTVFREDESGEMRQWILERKDLGFTIDYRDFRKEAEKKEKTEAYIAADVYREFDLAKGPLLRAALLQVAEAEYVFYFNMHHIISDAWSMEVLAKDVLKYYEAYKAGKAPGLDELRIQYKDYSSWQLSQLNQASFNTHRAYWLNKFSGVLPLLDLPTSKQRPQAKTYNGQDLATYIDKATTAKLKGYTREKGGSLFMGLLASWNVLMYLYTAEKDIIIGTAAAGREHADLEDQIGFYINTLALRNEVNPEESFNSFYSSVKEETLRSYDHQMYPFDRLVEELNLQRDTSRSPVFDISLTYHNITEIEDIGTLDDKVENQVSDNGFSNVKNDIELHFREIGDYIYFRLIYNKDVYDREMIERLMEHFKGLLSSILSHPEEKISQIDYLSEEEKRKLLFAFNDITVAYPKDKTIVDLFQEQAAKTPDNIAVVFKETVLIYRELDERSNQLAHYLRANYDIQPDDLLSIKQTRSEWMIISILGVLKAGGAYVPIDPEYPRERIDYIEKDTGCKVCVDETELNKFKESKDRYSKEPVTFTAKSDNLAYVIYTSGSTGNPKGVMISHGSLYSSTCTRNAYYDVLESYLLIPSFSFDSSVAVLWGSLTGGSTLYIVEDNHLKDLFSITGFITEHAIACILCVPSYYHLLLSHSTSGKLPFKRVILAGEALSGSLVEKHFSLLPECTLFNEYGPTENTVWSTVASIREETQKVHIGQPIGNTEVYIMGAGNKLVPIGVTGEICIGGNGLAIGYLNQEALTREKFISSPFRDGERLYKTGDLGRWLPDGNIAYLGRKDDQVKIRGYRIELGEIEHALLKHSAIEQAIVSAKENQSGEKELVAYITSNVEQNTSDLRAYLKDTLPAYMLPAHFVQLKAMPLTANGKVDKESLPDPAGLGLKSGVEYVAPKNKTEEKLIEIWVMVLGQENIGMNDDFFDLGGFSMRAIGLVAEYNKSFNVRVTVQELFEKTKLYEHARIIETRMWLNTSSEEKKLNTETIEF